MKKYTRSTVAAIAAGTAAALLVAGCTPQGGGGGGEDSAEDNTVTWWLWDSNPEAEEMAAAFEEENPDIHVDFKVYNYNDYLNALRPGLTATSGPDVFQVAPGAMLANYGPLAVDLTPYAQESLGEGWADEFNETAISQLSFEGAQAALPTYLSAAGYIYYNNTLVEDLGITVPTTVPEWAQTCETVTAAGYTCLAQGAKDAWVNLDVFLALANSVAPGSIYDAIDGTASWTDDDFVTAMEAWSSLFTDGIVGSGATAQTEYPDAFNEFLQNEAVFIAMGTWNTPGTQTNAGVAVSQEGVETEIDGIFLSAPFPAATADAEPTQPFGGTANGWAISAKSDTPDAAFSLIEFLSAGGGQDMIGSVASFPALQSAEVSTDDVIDPSQVEDISELQDSLNDLVGYREIPYPDLSAAMGQALSAVAAGTQSPTDALEAIQTASDAVQR